MIRFLLILSFILAAFAAFSQGSEPVKKNDIQWILRAGLNALDQISTSERIDSKSSLGFQIGGDIVWDPGWKLKGGFHYQHHEVMELSKQGDLSKNNDTWDRHFQRLKLTAGTIYDLIDIEFLRIGIGGDLAYNFDLSNHKRLYYNPEMPARINYLSSLFHVYMNIYRFQIDLGIEGNLSPRKGIKVFDSKTYALTVGYIF